MIIANLNSTRLVNYLLDQEWQQACEIIPDYMPPFPKKDADGKVITQPSVVVRFPNGTNYPPYLRHSRGPKQGFSWDVYGDNFLNLELAVIALSQAQCPIGLNVGPITFSIPLEPWVNEDVGADTK